MKKLLQKLRLQYYKRQERAFEYTLRRFARNLMWPTEHFENLDFIRDYYNGRFSAGFRYSLDVPPPDKKLRVAVCLSGFLRTWEQTLPALKKHLIERYNADVFIYAPNTAGLKADRPISEEELHAAFGENLKSVTLWNYDSARFSSQVRNLNIPPEVNGRDPMRTFSALFHVQKANDLKREYEEKQGFQYDFVIKTRADLALFSPVLLEGKNAPQTVYFPATSGFTDRDGKVIQALSAAFPYRNLERGEYIGAGDIFFNDVITFADSKTNDLMATAYENLEEYIQRGVLCNPETLMVYHICHQQRCAIEMQDFVRSMLFRETDLVVWNPQKANPKWSPHLKFLPKS